MEKEQTLMKKIFNILAVTTLVLTGLIATASAQEASTKKVQIDFDFYAGKKRMPAGEYIVKLKQNTGTHKLIVVQQVKGGSQAVVASVPSQIKHKLDPGSITFNRYGDQYFLSGVQLGSDRIIHKAIPSRAEREVLKKIAGYDNGSKPEKVTTQTNVQ
jgi:hypothetical protein